MTIDDGPLTMDQLSTGLKNPVLRVIRDRGKQAYI